MNKTAGKKTLLSGMAPSAFQRPPQNIAATSIPSVKPSGGTLEQTLAQKGARNPKALAAYIGRKKGGSLRKPPMPGY